jgi:hypothetical protein
VTERARNHCGACGHSWTPRGRSRSVRCPKCRSRRVGASGLSALVLFAAISFLTGRHDEGNRGTQANAAAAQAAPSGASTSPVRLDPTTDESARVANGQASATAAAGADSEGGEQKPAAISRQPEVGGEAGLEIVVPPPALRTFYVQFRTGTGALATQRVQAFDEAGARKVLRDFRGDPEILQGPATEVSW